MFENISIRKYTEPFTSRKKQAEQYTPEEGPKEKLDWQNSLCSTFRGVFCKNAPTWRIQASGKVRGCYVPYEVYIPSSVLLISASI